MITIAQEWLRVEYGGANEVPVKIVVPLVFPQGKHSDVRIRIEPRDGVRLGQSVETGDAFQQTFTTGSSGTVGASFFGSLAFDRSRSVGSPQFSVSMTPDFRSVIFYLRQLKVEDSMGIQVAFPVESYVPNPAADFFARVFVEVGGEEVAQCNVPQEVHPQAAHALVIDGLLDQLPGSQPIHLPAGPLVEFAPILRPSSRNEVVSALVKGWDIVHIVDDVRTDEVRLHGFSVQVNELFYAIEQSRTQLLFLSSCNSVRVVSRFRRSAASALIAATENLTTDYANAFEWEFYSSLSIGKLISESFSTAERKAGVRASAPLIRSISERYSPMFLDLKRDIAFGTMDC